MHNTERNMTAASIRYLLAVHALCAQGQGARCVDVAERLGVNQTQCPRYDRKPVPHGSGPEKALLQRISD